MDFKIGDENISHSHILRGFRLTGLTIFLIVLIFIMLVFMSLYIFLLNHFSIGDYIYSKNTFEVGKIDGLDFFRLGYLIKWDTGAYTSVPFWQIQSPSNKNDSDKSDQNTTLKVDSGTTLNFANKENKFNDYTLSNSGSGQTLIYLSSLGDFNYNSKPNCIPDFLCTDWGSCQTGYDLRTIMAGLPMKGMAYRYCKDTNVCFPDLIDSMACENKINITTRIHNWCNQDYLEVLDMSGNVLARLNNKDTNDYMDINLNLFNKGYCYYCYDNKKDFDEVGRDCGGSCASCR